MPARLTLADVRAAGERIRPLLAPTPLRPSLAAPDHDLRLKLECWQPTGSFKVRGALSAMAALSQTERRRGIVLPAPAERIGHQPRVRPVRQGQLDPLE